MKAARASEQYLIWSPESRSGGGGSEEQRSKRQKAGEGDDEEEEDPDEAAAIDAAADAGLLLEAEIPVAAAERKREREITDLNRWSICLGGNGI